MKDKTMSNPILVEEDEHGTTYKMQYEITEFIDSRIKEELRELIHEEVLKALKEYNEGK